MKQKLFSLNGMQESHISQLNNSIRPNTDVYIVGWRHDSSLWCYDFFSSINCSITLIEIFPNNANLFPKTNYPNVKVVCDDVQNYKKYLNNNTDDKLLYWGEGPEHLPMDVSKNLINDMKKYFNTIIIHTPHGEYLQGEMYGNIYETHLSTWYDYNYDALGFKHDRFHGPYNNLDAIIGYWVKE